LTFVGSRRYEKGHWDAVITKYKEVEFDTDPSLLDSISHQVLKRTQSFLLQQHLDSDDSTFVEFLPTHAIDLHRDGVLDKHVDSIRFSGNMVAGISLASPSIMRLRPSAHDDDNNNNNNNDDNNNDNTEHQQQQTTEQEHWVDLYLLPRSLYVLTGMSRFEYTHELLPSGSIFCLKNDHDETTMMTVERQQRISLIFRDGKKET